MRPDEPLADGEPKPGAGGGAGQAAVDPVEAVEDALAVLRRDAGPLVFHPHHQLVAADLGADVDGRGLPGVLGRVLDQIPQHNLDALRVGEQRGQVWRQVHLQAVAGIRVRPPGGVMHQVFQPAGSPLHLQAPRLDARHIQQVVHQPAQPVGLLLDHLQELALRAAVPLHVFGEQGGGIAFDRRHRGAQLVRDGGDQAGFHPVQLTVLGDIAQEKAPPQGRTVWVGHIEHLQAQVAGLPRAFQGQLRLPQAPPLHGGFDRPPGRGAVGGLRDQALDQGLDRGSAQILRRQIDDLPNAPVHVQHPPLQVLQDQAILHGLDQCLQPPGLFL